jgi:diketogulonate reductase-like aldo/keto reductase
MAEDDNTNLFPAPAIAEMPALLYGTAWKKERTAELVALALKTGFRGFDTAAQPRHYDEELVGSGLQYMHELGLTREELYLQTKFTPMSSQDPEQLPYDNKAPLQQQVRQSFAVSQDNLKTDYIDTLLLHSPLDTYEQTLQAWEALQDIQQQGGARHLGICNCYDLDLFKQLYTDASVKPTVVQNRFYKDTNYEQDMRAYCRQHGIIFESFWSLTANQHVVGSNTLKNIAVQYQRTSAQVFFRYLNQLDIVPLTGTSSEQHMQEDLAILDFILSEDDLELISLCLNQ